MAIYIVAWFAIVLPLIGAGGSFFADSPRRSAQICRVFGVVSFLLTLVVLGTRLKMAGQAPFNSFITFFTTNPSESGIFASRFEPLLGVHVDSISAVFAAVMGFAGVAIQAYATVSLRGDRAFRRFFWAASLLMFALLGLAYSPNLLQFWVMSGVASVAVYILLLHRWERQDGAANARRIFLTFFSADIALLLAVVFVFIKFGIFASAQPAPSGSDIFDPLSFSGLPTIITAAQHNQIAGLGLRSLEVMSILVLVVAFVRSAQIPFHAWLGDAVDAPLPVIALITTTAGISGVYLLARVYPLLMAAPHVLSAVAAVGAATAAVCGALALAQRDIYRVGALVSAALFGVAIAALGAGGFAAGLYGLAAATLLSTLFFFAAGNVVRAYRTREITEMSGAWRRMPVTSVGLGAWAAGAGGLSLSLYYALAAAFDNRFPNGGHLGDAARAVCVTLLIIGGIVVAMAAFNLVLRVLRGEAVRRRGFQPERVADVPDASRRWVLVAVVAAILLVAFALPGVGRLQIGRTGEVGLTWTQLVVIGPGSPAVQVVFGALGISLLTLLLGAVAAALLQTVPRRELTPAFAAQLAAVGARARDLMVEPIVRRLGRPVVAAGRLVGRFDDTVIDNLVESVGEGVTLAAEGASRMRRLRSSMYLASAAALVGLLVVLSLLAATGHLGGVTL